MRELVRSNDPVLLSFLEALLRDAGIGVFIADQYISILEGSIGAFPRRALVATDDWSAAVAKVEAAGLGHWIVRDEAHGGSGAP
jgi:Putative prokaryotic signal transducing protein